MDNMEVYSSSSQEAGQAQPRHRFRCRASNMSFNEMVEMVTILRREDYDAKHGPYMHPNKVKAQIMEKVIRRLQRKFGKTRSREHLRKRWSDLKKREPHQLYRINKVIRRRSKFFPCVFNYFGVFFVPFFYLPG